MELIVVGSLAPVNAHKPEKNDSSRSVMRHLVFACDGDDSQILGISIVLRSLRQRFVQSTQRETIWIVAPPRAHDRVIQWFTAAHCDADLRLIAASHQTDDRYFVQLLLVEAFKQINNSSTVTCLDYDHVVLDPSGHPVAASPKMVTMSSETRPVVQSGVMSAFGDQPDLARLNTSLIVGTASTLRRVGSQWFAAYEEMRLVAPRRYLAEISFGLAAHRTHVPAIPCGSVVQGNFANPTPECFVFHYGGESQSALSMKGILRTNAEALALRACPTGEDLDRIERTLRGTLLERLSLRVE